MKDKQKLLASAIEAKQARFMEAKQCELKYLASIYLHEVDGLKEAFQIVFGISFIDYICMED
jgi:hypothetical protein